MKFQIKDFVDSEHIDVEAMDHNGTGLVLLRQNAGSMHFQHSMRPDQARFLAGALVIAAEQAETLNSSANTLEAQP